MSRARKPLSFNTARTAGSMGPVKSGKQVRGRFKMLSAEEKRASQWQITYEVTVEIEDEEKPALIADWIGYMASSPSVNGLRVNSAIALPLRRGTISSGAVNRNSDLHQSTLSGRPRARSSVGQSTSLLSLGSQVRILPGAPVFCDFSGYLPFPR